MPLSEQRRQQLDGIVSQMVANKEKDSDIQFVVNDFKSKYGNETPQKKIGLIEKAGNLSDQFLGGLTNVVKGAGKGALSTVKNLSSMGEQGLNYAIGQGKLKQSSFNQLQGLAENKIGLPQGALTTPTTIGQKLGFAGEQIGEFFIPGGVAAQAGKTAEGANILSKAPGYIQKGAGLLARGGVDALTTAGISKAQGSTNQEAGTNALIAGLAPAAGKIIETATDPLKKLLSQKIAPGMINRLIKPSAKEFNFGKNPGQGIVDEGIKARNLQGLFDKVSSKKEELGQMIDKNLKAPGVISKQINVTEALAPIDEAMQKAVRSGDQTFYNRLVDLKQGLTKEFSAQEGKLIPIGDKRLVLNPLETAQLKREIGGAAKWTGQPFDSEVNQVRVAIYRNLNNLVEKAAPGTKKLNSRYANILGAEKSLEKTIANSERNNLFGLNDIISGIGMGGISSLGGGDPLQAGGLGLATAILRKGVRSTPARTFTASQLGKFRPGQKTMLGKSAPLLKNLFFTQNNSSRDQ